MYFPFLNMYRSYSIKLLIGSQMEVLGEKLLKELPDDACVIAARFPFPYWPLRQSVGSDLDETFAYDISTVRSHLRKGTKIVEY